MHPRVQSRGHIGSLIFPAVDGALDLQVTFTVVISRYAQRIVLVRDYLPGLPVERIIYSELFGVSERWIATHVLVCYSQVKLVAVDLGIQSRGHISCAVLPTVDGAIDEQTAISVVAVRESQSLAFIENQLIILTIEGISDG